MLRITSRNNEKIKNAAKLCSESSYRKKTGMFFLEGLRLCCDAAENGIHPEEVFVSENAMEKYASELEVLLDSCDDCYVITEEIAAKLSDTKTNQGVFCVCKTLDKFSNIDKINYNGIYIAMENIQTPDNLGAAARTAEALGLDGIIVSGGCDIYNPKALRAAMGSLLRLEVFSVPDLPSFIEKCNVNGMNTYAAVPDNTALPVTQIDKSKGIVCVVGNEGNGLTGKTISSCSSKVTIPMKGRAESLNAAAAACMIMWEMVR
ncbi:MAG: RNA methyltransferase [Clostridia bacterium]|nr:RNA methyltransferase [Clostridia bacterium]